MRLIDDWHQAWKWLSVQFIAVAAALQLAMLGFTVNVQRSTTRCVCTPQCWHWQCTASFRCSPWPKEPSRLTASRDLTASILLIFVFPSHRVLYSSDVHAAETNQKVQLILWPLPGIGYVTTFVLLELCGPFMHITHLDVDPWTRFRRPAFILYLTHRKHRPTNPNQFLRGSRRNAVNDDPSSCSYLSQIKLTPIILIVKGTTYSFLGRIESHLGHLEANVKIPETNVL